MRSIILGIMVTQQPTTTLTVNLPELDPDATVYIAQGSDKEYTQISRNGLTFQASLAPGQYVLLVDSTLRPSTTKPFTVTTDADASFWSAAHPDPGTNPRPWQGGTGRTVIASDPKDPWPPPPLWSSISEAFLTSNSPIANTLSELLVTNIGRGATATSP